MQVNGYGSAAAMQMMQQMHQKLFAQADADGSGGLSLEEFKSIGQNAPAGKNGRAGAPDPTEMFGKLDSDGDGNLTATEMKAGRPRPPFGAEASGALLKLQEDFANADADGSGGLSLEEFSTLGPKGLDGAGAPESAPDPSELFAELDADGDGSLTVEEMKAGHPRPPFSPEAAGSLLQAQEDSTSDITEALAALKEAVDGDSSDDEVSSLVSQLTALIEEYFGTTATGSTVATA